MTVDMQAIRRLDVSLLLRPAIIQVERAADEAKGCGEEVHSPIEWALRLLKEAQRAVRE